MNCKNCGAINLETSAACMQCHHVLPKVNDVQIEVSKDEASKIELWSPDKAAFFSIIFSPIFGAVIHALNWKALGEKSKSRMSWIWAVLIWLAFSVVTASGEAKLYDFEVITMHLQLTQMVIIVLWYFLSARAQSKYLVTHYPQGYTKKSWVYPICFSIIIFGSLAWLQNQA